MLLFRVRIPGYIPKTPGGFIWVHPPKKPQQKTDLKPNCIVLFNNMFCCFKVIKPISRTLLNIFRYSKVLV